MGQSAVIRACAVYCRWCNLPIVWSSDRRKYLAANRRTVNRELCKKADRHKP